MHPALWEAVDALERGDWMLGGDAAGSLPALQKAWTSAYGRGCLNACLGYAAANALGIWLGYLIDHPGPFFLAMLGSAAHAINWYRVNRRTVTVDELEALLPIIPVDPNLRLYAETLLDLYRQRVDATLRREAIQEMNALIEDDQSLGQARKRLEAAIARTDARSLEAEIDQLQSKADGTTDAMARVAYEEALALARSRQESARRRQPLLDRIDAQQEVIRQTLLRLRADLGRSGEAGLHAPIVVAGGIRDILSRIRSQADEIERAVQELDQA